MTEIGDPGVNVNDYVNAKKNAENLIKSDLDTCDDSMLSSYEWAVDRKNDKVV